MKADFNGLWAESPSTLRREPTPAEIAGGFPCGPFDLPLFNELMFRLSEAQREIVFAIIQSGQTPNANNNTQLWNAMRTLAPSKALVHTGTTAGTATAMLADVDPSITAYEQGVLYTLKMTNAAAGATTVNLDNIGVRAVKRADGSAIQNGDWIANQEVLFVDNGAELRIATSQSLTQVTSFVAQSPVGRGLVAFTAPGAGSWTVPSIAGGAAFDVFWVYAMCIGAGAGGSGSLNGGTRSGAGGGAGGTAAGWFQVTPGQVIPYVVGAGSAGVGYQANSANGGSSSISTLLAATGGGGVGNSGLAGGAGGLGAGGQLNLFGGAGVDGNSVNPSNPAGPGGASSLGGGGRSATEYQAAFSDGRAPGSGGGGTYNATLTSPGGNGAPGYVSFQF